MTQKEKEWYRRKRRIDIDIKVKKGPQKNGEK